MLVLVKTPVTCILFMIYMIVFYYRKPHVPRRSTKIFQLLIVAALLNSSFDLITIFTVNHRDVIPETLVVVVCSTLILLGLILSHENAEKYVDEKTALFNQ